MLPHNSAGGVTRGGREVRLTSAAAVSGALVNSRRCSAMQLPEERALAEPAELLPVNGASTEGGAKRKSKVSALPDHEWTGCARKARSRVTRFHVALALAAVLFMVTVGLLVHIVVLKRSQCSEQPQTKGAQSNAAADGKDGEVLPPCDDDWIWYRNKCFYFSDAEGDWTEAKDSCAVLNSSLALIDTQKELDFMLRYKGERHHWIGLQRETDQHWKWVNGTEFSNWFPVENFSECAYLSHERAKSAECYSTRNWICTKVSTYERKRKKRSLILQHFQ